MLYSLALVPVTLAPTLMGMTGWTYFAGALLLGGGLLWFSLRMWTMKLAPVVPHSKAARPPSCCKPRSFTCRCCLR